MRISDWSSDVCSSDLKNRNPVRRVKGKLVKVDKVKESDVESPGDMSPIPAPSPDIKTLNRKSRDPDLRQIMDAVSDGKIDADTAVRLIKGLKEIGSA